MSKKPQYISTNRSKHYLKCHLILVTKYRKILWSDGFFVCSIGEASPETIRQYILTQG